MDFYSFLLSRQNRQHSSAQQSVKILYSKSSHDPFSCKPWKQWNPYSVEGPQYHFCPFRCTSVVVVVWTNSWVNLVLISRHTILFFPCLCWPAPFLQIRSYLTYLSFKTKFKLSKFIRFRTHHIFYSFKVLSSSGRLNFSWPCASEGSQYSNWEPRSYWSKEKRENI